MVKLTDNYIMITGYRSWERAFEKMAKNFPGSNYSWIEGKNGWILKIGDQPLFIGDTKEELKAFVLGLAYGLNYDKTADVN